MKKVLFKISSQYKKSPGLFLTTLFSLIVNIISFFSFLFKASESILFITINALFFCANFTLFIILMYNLRKGILSVDNLLDNNFPIACLMNYYKLIKNKKNNFCNEIEVNNFQVNYFFIKNENEKYSQKVEYILTAKNISLKSFTTIEVAFIKSPSNDKLQVDCIDLLQNEKASVYLKKADGPHNFYEIIFQNSRYTYGSDLKFKISVTYGNKDRPRLEPEYFIFNPNNFAMDCKTISISVPSYPDEMLNTVLDVYEVKIESYKRNRINNFNLTQKIDYNFSYKAGYIYLLKFYTKR